MTDKTRLRLLAIPFIGLPALGILGMVAYHEGWVAALTRVLWLAFVVGALASLAYGTLLLVVSMVAEDE